MLIGLTGGIGSGKSTVSNMLLELNFPVIDADKIARQVVEPGERAYEKIVAHFGESVLEEDGQINRKKLGAIIFNNEEERKVLNSIVHPAVRAEMEKQKNDYRAAGNEVIIFDIPLLFESKLTHLVEKTLLVYVDEEVQLERLLKRDKTTLEDAKSRIGSQIPLKEKRSLADEVIDNNGSIENTKKQLLQILKKWNIVQ